MKAVGYLLVTLVIMIVVYAVYRNTFLIKRKPKSTPKSHFTLKIEPEI